MIGTLRRRGTNSSSMYPLEFPLVEYSIVLYNGGREEKEKRELPKLINIKE